MQGIIVLMAVLSFAGASSAASRSDFVDIADVAPNIIVDMRYASENNFVGARIDGYQRARCLLAKDVASALARAQRDLDRFGLRFKVFDCYRPQRAVEHFARWSEDANDIKTKPDYYPKFAKPDLFANGYIAEKSGHSRGGTVDLTIEGLAMGGTFDFFDEISHTAYPDIDQQARANRLLLRRVMEARGFRNYDKEWWHYTFAEEPYPNTYFDFVIK